MRLFAVVVIACVLASAAFGATRHPRLRLAQTHSLVVVGSNFRAGERVKLVVHAARLIVVHARARHGSFTARLGTVPMPRCGDVRIVAVGSKGSRAALTLRRPACSPPPAGP